MGRSSEVRWQVKSEAGPSEARCKWARVASPSRVRCIQVGKDGKSKPKRGEIQGGQVGEMRVHVGEMRAMQQGCRPVGG